MCFQILLSLAKRNMTQSHVLSRRRQVARQPETANKNEAKITDVGKRKTFKTKLNLQIYA